MGILSTHPPAAAPDDRHARRRPWGAVWREAVLTRVAELRALAEWLASRPGEPLDGDERVINSTLEAAAHELEAATAVAIGRAGRSRLSQTIAGTGPERARGHVDTAETALLRIAPASFVRGQIPELQARVRGELSFGDPRRAAVDRVTRDSDLSLSGRDVLVSALHAANATARRNLARVRSFRNVIVTTAVTMTLLAVALAILAAIDPTAAPACFTFPGGAACPTAVATGVANPLRAAASPWDMLFLEVAGVVGAAISSAWALRGRPSLPTPFSLSTALLALKLSTGAITAVVGILLMRGSFIPGFGRLQEPAEILSWAVVFGAGQHLLTRLVAGQAHTVVNTWTRDGGPGPTAEPSGGDIDRAVATSLQAALAGPTLVNFTGAVSVVVRGAERDDVRFVLPPDVAPVLDVTLGPKPEPGGVSAPVMVEEGDVAPVARFIVTVDGDRLESSRLEQPADVPVAGPPHRLQFRLDLRAGTELFEIWVRVTQHGRLLQIVPITILARP